MVLNQKLKVIGEAWADNTCGNCEGRFKAKVEYSVNKNRNGTIKAYHQDSDRTYCDEVAVTLKP